MTRPAIASIERVLWAMPEGEHQMFATAIARRAADWRDAGLAGQREPATCPIVVIYRQGDLFAVEQCDEHDGEG